MVVKKMIKKTLWTAAIGACLLAFNVASAAIDSEKDNDAIEKNLNKVLVDTFRSAPDSVAESVIPGLYQVMYGTEIVYLSADGQYFISGDLLNLKTRQNMTEFAQRDVRKNMVEKFDTEVVTFKAENEKHVLRVFTDIDCGYCAKLHREIKEINDKGITIEYMAFPRAGIGSPSYDKIVSVWCADDQQDAMTKSKNRQAVPNKTCENPIKAQYELGQQLGVNGTPALLTESGQLIPGYMPADRLLATLDKEKPKSVFNQ
ncbi:DsbC family protein [Leucothrix sargassi]|nr:DsbC family protein [Leucothrix sargassi]